MTKWTKSPHINSKWEKEKQKYSYIYSDIYIYNLYNHNGVYHVLEWLTARSDYCSFTFISVLLAYDFESRLQMLLFCSV